MPPGSQKERLELRIDLLSDEAQSHDRRPPFHVLLCTCVMRFRGPPKGLCARARARPGRLNLVRFRFSRRRKPRNVHRYNIVAGHKEDRAFLRHYRLDCLILDEGHLMKNAASQRYQHLMRLRVRQDASPPAHRLRPGDAVPRT